MAEKIKFGFLRLGGCAGCDMAIVDMSDKLIDKLEHLDVVFWAPAGADFKYKDLENMDDNFIDFAFVSGMVRFDEHEDLLKILRKKSKTLVAFGICASLGGIPAMANLHPAGEVLDKAYKDTFTTDNPEDIRPMTKCLVEDKYELTLPALLDKVKCASDVVEVDYLIGGCPPHHEFLAEVIEKITSYELPPKGSWIGTGKSVCDNCGRNPAQKGQKRQIAEDIKRTFEGTPEEEKCLLEQGYLCFGPFTEGFCGASCPKVGIPCRGCGGPLPEVKDFGAQGMSVLGSILSDKATDKLFKKYPNFTKFIYRYSLAGSLIEKIKNKG